jgi:hypothetical protein
MATVDGRGKKRCSTPREGMEVAGHPFCQRLNVLNEARFDAFCEQRSREFFYRKMGLCVAKTGSVSTK